MLANKRLALGLASPRRSAAASNSAFPGILLISKGKANRVILRASAEDV
jgi:hypothetical protein